PVRAPPGRPGHRARVLPACRGTGLDRVRRELCAAPCRRRDAPDARDDEGARGAARSRLVRAHSPRGDREPRPPEGAEVGIASRVGGRARGRARDRVEPQPGRAPSRVAEARAVEGHFAPPLGPLIPREVHLIPPLLPSCRLQLRLASFANANEPSEIDPMPRLIVLCLLSLSLVTSPADSAKAPAKAAVAPRTKSLLEGVEIYGIDAPHSEIGFSVVWMGISRVRGSFQDFI